MKDRAEAEHKESKYTEWSRKKSWLGASATLPRYIHELRIVEGHCWQCWCQHNAIRSELWDRWQYNKTGIRRLLSPLYCLALSLPSILMVLLFDCWRWENIMFGTPAYFMESATFWVLWWIIFHCVALLFPKVNNLWNWGREYCNHIWVFFSCYFKMW